MRKPFIAGNWKMFKTTGEAAVFAEEFKKIYHPSDVQTGICAPFTQLKALKDAFKDTDIKLGAQNMHFEESGAFTGEISAEMLTEIGVDYCIIGHSERRQYFNETDYAVNKKLLTAFKHNIIPILCVGEVLEERDACKEHDVVRRQMTAALKDLTTEQTSALVIAYEPVWAIGTGRNASPEQANEMCGYIRSIIEELYDDEVSEKVIIQYGGSVKPANISELMSMEEIDGALVGGASLAPETFIEIINF
ncbi:MAG: triose-phosphate isomerase [Eubacteriales bacterium]|nr:triose-phosphate isomerase [Eubacteriales bacterium]MDD3198860.1 triose-phosphate isomerase [Eubacteriales bacterium]MDD4121447.1 triose-phosphate isomerase [Eubacteriales bacterium]MDD4629241.1 triose-phosphate isomerase [Eubacteriales bacterium]